MKIYAPVKDSNGVWCSVRFVNGVGETDNPHLIDWFKKHGYRVEECEEIAPIPMEKCEEITETPSKKCESDDLDSMTPNQLREWLKSNGYGSQIKNIRDKEKLLKIARG